MQPAATPAGDSRPFEQQFSQALSESLARLGVSPGSVNIRITGTGGPSAREIVITYDASSTTRTPAQTPQAPATSTEVRGPACETPWSEWKGPRDSRDEVAAGGGQLTSSGAPLIQINNRPASNQYGYTGLAALNPYFTSPSNPNRAGYVLGFANWFRDTQVLGGKNGPVPANRLYYATEEGAQEALRLVRQHEPDAQLVQFQWGGGPYSTTNAMYYVSLPGERMMNAGLILSGYYNGGEGVTISSDADLQRSVRGA